MFIKTQPRYKLKALDSEKGKGGSPEDYLGPDSDWQNGKLAVKGILCVVCEPAVIL